jgi:hypothetical protein
VERRSSLRQGFPYGKTFFNLTLLESSFPFAFFRVFIFLLDWCLSAILYREYQELRDDLDDQGREEVGVYCDVCLHVFWYPEQECFVPFFPVFFRVLFCGPQPNAVVFSLADAATEGYFGVVAAMVTYGQAVVLGVSYFDESHIKTPSVG